MKSPIELYLSKEITSKNKIPFSEFMDIALFHKEYGYYTNKSQIFGSEGDFITSPLISCPAISLVFTVLSGIKLHNK